VDANPSESPRIHMTSLKEFSEEERDKLAKELLKLRASDAKRSRERTRAKREAGMTKISMWVPKDRAEEFRSLCRNALTKHASAALIEAMPRHEREAAEQHHPEHMRDHHP
jgi:vacuolar-type H+-ATPase subunit I/STV1